MAVAVVIPPNTTRERIGQWAERGDVFFTHSESLLGRLIRWGERDPGEEPSWTNHTGVVVSSGWLVPPDNDPKQPLAVVVEALWRVQQARWWESHRGEWEKGYEVRVFSPVPGLNPTESLRFLAQANSFVGDRYGWWKLLGLLVDRMVFRGHKVISRCFFIDCRPICSYLAAIACAGVGRSFGIPPQAADPDEMLDYCLAHPEAWEERQQVRPVQVPLPTQLLGDVAFRRSYTKEL